MELSDYVNTLRRHALVIVVLVLLGAVAGFSYARNSPPLYQSSSSIFVSATRGENSSDLVQGSVYTQNLMQSFAQLVHTPAVLDPVIDSLDLGVSANDLGQKISADAPLNTVIVVVTVTDESPQEAAKIANAVTAELATVARELSPKNADGTPGVTLAQVGKATPAPAPFAPNTRLLLVAGAGLGLLAALSIVIARHLLYRRINTDADLQLCAPAPVVGRVSQARRRSRQQIMVGDARDAFLQLADRLANIQGRVPIRSLVVSSASHGEGKTHIALNLAVAMAELKARVLFLEADFRTPTVARLCGRPDSPGLSDVLQQRLSVHADASKDSARSLELAIVPWRNIWLLPAGTASRNPTRLLNSPAMEKIFIDLLRDFDFIVCDSTAILAAADTLPLARITDGAVLVARAHRTKHRSVATAAENITAASGKVAGLVLNGVHRSGWRGFLRIFHRTAREPRDTARLAEKPGTVASAPQTGPPTQDHAS